MTTTITEAIASADLSPAGTGGLFRVRVIDAGMGSSGYYPAETLEAAGRAGVVAVGTHAYFDHPSESEMSDRPERSVRDLAAVFKSTGTYDPTTKAIEADVQVFGPYRDLFADPDFREAIGMSIRAFAEVEEGEVDGRRVPIVKTLESIASVDFVTHAGRGGKMLALLESARDRVSGRAIRRGVTEATANDTRDLLRTAVTQTHAGADDTWAWVRDFDDSTVWFEITADGAESLWQQTYALADGVVTLTGQAVQVRQVTTYVPVQPGSQQPQFTTATATEGSHDPTHVPPVSPAGSTKENDMPQNELTLEEAAGRVRALETERDTAVQRADTAEAALAEARARTTARPVVTGVVAESTTIPAALQPAVVEAVLAVVTGEMDEAAIRTAAEAARTAKETEITTIAESLGAGQIHGFGGGTGTGTDISEADLDRELAAAFDRQTKEV